MPEIDCFSDGGNGFGFVGAAPKLTANRPSTQTDARDRCWDVRTTNRFCSHKMDYSIFGESLEWFWFRRETGARSVAGQIAQRVARFIVYAKLCDARSAL